jgi:ribokinase
MAHPNGRLFVVGSSNTDLVALVERLPAPGETVMGGDLAVFAGGKGANQAVAAARAGAAVHFVGAFGDDDHSNARRADLERDGIDCGASARKRSVPGGVALIGVQRGRGGRAENAIIVAPGANARLSTSDVRRALKKLGGGDVLLCSLEVPLEAVEAAVRLARARGALVVLNPAPYPASGLAPALIEACDIVTPNQGELEAMLGAPLGSRKALSRLRTIGSGEVTFIVTRGAAGVDLYAQGVYREQAVTPYRVKAVDTVGAGDCFSGCLAAELTRKPSDLLGALRYAVAASAISVTRRGAQSSMPRRAEVMRLLRSGGKSRSKR